MPLARVAWCARHEPPVFERTREHVLVLIERGVIFVMMLLHFLLEDIQCFGAAFIDLLARLPTGTHSHILLALHVLIVLALHTRHATHIKCGGPYYI